MAGNDNHRPHTADLPDGWVWTTLGEIRQDNSRAITPNKTPDELFELYSVPAFETGTPEIVRGTQVGSNKQIVEEDTVLLCKINPRINRVWIVGSYSSAIKIASTEWINFSRIDGVDPRYLCYFMCTSAFRDFLALNVSGVGGSLMRVRPNSISDYPFPLAPLPEQHHIVARIEELFTRLEAGVAALKQAQAGLWRYKAAVLKAACEGRLVPQDLNDGPATKLLERILAERRAKWEADLHAKGKDQRKAKYEEPKSPEVDGLPELPSGWCWVPVEQLAAHEPNSITDGPFGSNLKTEHYTESGPRVIRLQNIGDGVFHDEEAHISHQHFERLRKHQVFAGDIVIAALGESLPRACVIPDHLGEAIVKADCIRFKPHLALADSRYLNAALNSEVLKKLAGRIIHGIGRPRLNQQEIKSLPIPLPPINEQRRIVDEVERRLSVVQELEATISASLARSERLRQSILKRAFAGKLVPQDASDEPASALLKRIRSERVGATLAVARKTRPNERTA